MEHPDALDKKESLVEKLIADEDSQKEAVQDKELSIWEELKKFTEEKHSQHNKIIRVSGQFKVKCVRNADEAISKF